MPDEPRSTSRWPIAIVLIGIVVLAAVGAVLTSTGTSGPAEPSGPRTSASAFEGVEQHGNVIGSPAAPATLVEYVDPQCPFCGEASRNLTDTILNEYVKTGKLNWRIELLTFMGEESKVAAQAAWAAAKWDKYGEFVTEFLRAQKEPNSGYVTPKHIGTIFEQIGVPRSEAMELMVSREIVAQAESAAKRAKKHDVERTPTFGLETDKFVALDIRDYTSSLLKHEIEAATRIK